MVKKGFALGKPTIKAGQKRKGNNPLSRGGCLLPAVVFTLLFILFIII